MIRRAQRLHGDKLEEAIDKIEDANARDALYELLLRTRQVTSEHRERIEELERKLRSSGR